MTTRLLEDHVKQGITFIPADPTPAVGRLLDEVASLRQSALVAMSLRLMAESPQEPKIQEFAQTVRAFSGLSQAERRRIVDHPAFLVWLRLATQDADFDDRLDEFVRLVGRLTTPSDAARIAGSVEVRRHDVDTLIRTVAPPTYTFANVGDKDNSPNGRSAYTLEFFREVADVAFARIGTTWPAVAELFPTVVHTIVHVPDGDFRSASASRYTGVVFLSADDDAILSLEESLVHEFSHQLLYRVMEIDPLITNESDTEFRLPWSGAERDYYGFFHAFYIYVVLAMYYGRVAKSRSSERRRAIDRQLEILTGLEAAVPEILRAGRFTRVGEAFARQMCQNALNLVAIQRREEGGVT